MKTNPRISSVIKASAFDSAVIDLPSFDLQNLIFENDLTFELPTNLRLGHIVEKIVGELFKLSTNYNLLYENIQIRENKNTIGELDFIIEDKQTQEKIHLEFAYKFYLLDPNISDTTIMNWIGPNRNDSLIKKLEKLKTKQFPLLFHPSAERYLPNIAIKEVKQALCLLVSYFVPYQFEGNLAPMYQKSIKGYYINLKTFLDQPIKNKEYYQPPKKEWGIDPSHHKNWISFDAIKTTIHKSLQEKQAPLVWQKHKSKYRQFFVVWW